MPPALGWQAALSQVDCKLASCWLRPCLQTPAAMLASRGSRDAYALQCAGCTPACRCLRQCRAEGLDRESTLFRLATTVEGVYVPQFYDAPGG